MTAPRWLTLPVPADAPRPSLGEGDKYRVRTPQGTIRAATWTRTPGGGWAFVGRDGQPVDVVAVEIPEPRRGRPPGPPENVRRRVFLIRLTDAELGVFTGAAQTAGESAADWARRVLMSEAMAPFQIGGTKTGSGARR